MIFQIIAIIILAVFYGCYFIKMISQRRKGIQTDQIGKGKVGFVKFIEVTMKIITIIVPLAEIVCIILNTSVLPVWARIVGICIAVTGLVVFITSVVTMRDSWRAGVSKTDKTELVTSGIYSFSRNPAFLGFDLVYVGVLLMFFNLILFIISVLGVIIFNLQIVNVEEDFLIDTFREEYINYKKKVCRYFGRR
ncbi:MAG: methyltransferase family protein [Ruminococcus sp.]